MTYADALAILDGCDHGHSCDHGRRFGWQGRENLCEVCLKAAVRAWRAARREQLAAEPRCQVPGCSRRGATWAMGVLTCQAHFTRANRAHLRGRARSGGVGLFLAVTYSPEQWLEMARGGTQ